MISSVNMPRLSLVLSVTIKVGYGSRRHYDYIHLNTKIKEEHADSVVIGP